MDSIDIVPRNSELNAEISLERLSELIGEQGIIDGPREDSDFFYLAGIAIDGQQGDSSVEDILMEYIRNCRTFEDLTDDEFDQIEEILR